MEYRDERDALRGRVENLEQELGEAKRELVAQQGDDKAARVAQLEKDLTEARGALQDVRRELSELKGTEEAPQPATDMQSVAPATKSDVVGRTLLWMKVAAFGLIVAFCAALLCLGGISYEGRDVADEITWKEVGPWGALGLLVAIVGAVGAVRARRSAPSPSGAELPP